MNLKESRGKQDFQKQRPPLGTEMTLVWEEISGQPFDLSRETAVVGRSPLNNRSILMTGIVYLIVARYLLDFVPAIEAVQDFSYKSRGASLRLLCSMTDFEPPCSPEHFGTNSDFPRMDGSMPQYKNRRHSRDVCLLRIWRSHNKIELTYVTWRGGTCGSRPGVVTARTVPGHGCQPLPSAPRRASPPASPDVCQSRSVLSSAPQCQLPRIGVGSAHVCSTVSAPADRCGISARLLLPN
ncbi:hypothetical protein RRG08_008055 [Elysia crispata]|uniref:Uncharacterized protein n=1 Tax=Elysia crispata TaxID=231223 RepID=A0AAE1D6K2_9GAST|nr:hypothetical protein RRG08_008055 [Elysia crispata]